MSFLVKNEELLKKYSKIWEKISNIMKKGFDSGKEFNNKYLKVRIKFYGDKIKTNFHDGEMPK